ncbi:hypothetical protein [Nocardia arthritidis]|uniref:Uncharacterized protein n=1 Tax=Nocardia arthritidis TaxID=228602 RepID=A0A6G9Y973_9NOCA|nr:hypothetical protein [Nocardia arthritidis]QIS09772.1 hypothetical protein F5544_09360 [Nocardia arthritidis]
MTTMQVFASRITARMLAKADDPRLRGLDVRIVLRDAVAALPAWYRYAIVVRWILATAGSIAVIVLLSSRSADTYFA